MSLCRPFGPLFCTLITAFALSSTVVLAQEVVVNGSSPVAPAAPGRTEARLSRGDARDEHRDQRDAVRAERREAKAARAQQNEAILGDRAAERERREAARIAQREERLAEREERLAEREERLRDKLNARTEARAHRLAQNDERLQRAEAHRRLHRVLFNLGFAPSMVLRTLPERDRSMRADVGRLRQRTAEFGFSYIHDLNERVGIKVGAAFGVGATHIGLGRKGDDCCGDGDVKVDPSYSLALDAAPVITLGRSGFYAAPGLATRLFFLPQHRAAVTAEADTHRGDAHDPLTRTVGFKSPAVAIGLRAAFGLRLGKNHEYDLSFGGDAGAALRNAMLYVSTFVRFGVAFTDIAHGAGG